MAPFHIRLSARPQARLHPLLSIPWCQDVADLVRLPLHVASTAELAEAALGLALDHGLAAYDAAYVALAQKLSLPLISAEEALIRRLDGTDLEARWLGEWPA